MINGGVVYEDKRAWKKNTRKEVREIVEPKVTYIGMIERGEKFPKLEVFIKMANVLEASADELLMDVVHQSYKLRMSRYAEKISRLEKREKQRLYHMLDAYLENC